MDVKQLKIEFQGYKKSVLETVRLTTANRLPIQADHFAKWNIDVLNNIERIIDSVRVSDEVLDVFEIKDWQNS